MKKRDYIFIGLVLMITVLLVITINISKNNDTNINYLNEQEQEKDTTSEQINFIIDEQNDKVYFEDNKTYIDASPHTLKNSGWVEYNLISKVYTGNIDFAVGVNTNDLQPKMIQRYNPYSVTEQKSYVCDDVNQYFNYTLSPKHFYCYDTSNATYTLIYEHDFDNGDLELKTAYWNETTYYDWVDVNNNNFDVINYNYDNKNKWYYVKNIPITAEQNYKFRIFYQIPQEKFRPKKIYSKYDIAFKPSSETFTEAIQNNHFYLLDPWVNSTGDDQSADYLDTGLVFYATLNLSAGTNAPNDVDGRFNMTLLNMEDADWKSSPIYTNWVLMDGADESVRGSEFIDISAQEAITFSVWINTTSVASEDPVFFLGTNASDGNKYIGVRSLGGNFTLQCRDGGDATIRYGTEATTGVVNHIVAIFNNTVNQAEIYVNNVPTQSSSSSGAGCSVQNMDYDTISAGWYFTTANKYANMFVDEIAIWNRSLNSSEVEAIYNSGLGSFYTSSAPAPPASDNITITLNNPVDYFNSTTTNVTFNCSGNSTNGLLNLSLYLDGVINYTVTNSSSDQNLSLQIENNISDDTHNWTCEASDYFGSLTTTNRTLTVDGTSPSISYVGFDDDISYGYDGLSIQVNWTINDSNLDTCYYEYNGTNTTVDCAYNNVSVVIDDTKQYSFGLWANDTFGNLNGVIKNWAYKIFLNSETYNNITFETLTENYKINVTFNDSYTTTNASLIWDSTLYNADLDGEEFNSSVIMPSTDTQITKNFYWNFTADTDNIQSATNTITINPLTSLTISSGACPSGYNLVLYYVFKDEQNNTNVTHNIDYNFIYGINNFTAIETYGTASSTNDLKVCMNDTINNLTLSNGELRYSETNYNTNTYYMYYGFTIYNNTQTNYTIYNLLSSESTSFKLEVEDTTLNPYVNKYTRLLRWYPNFNEYRTVEMGLTDDNGDTVIHVEAEDTDYRVGVYELNGTLIKLANPNRMVCLIDPCTYTLKVDSAEDDFTSFLGVTSNIAYNSTTSIWTYTFSDDSGLTPTMNMTVYRLTATAKTPVCSSTTTGVSGAITCNTSAYSGTLKAEVTRTASPTIIIISKIVETTTTAFKNTWGLFLTMLVAIPLIFILAFMSPITAIIAGIVALLPAYFFGSISWGVVAGFIVLAGFITFVLNKLGGR